MTLPNPALAQVALGERMLWVRHRGWVALQRLRKRDMAELLAELEGFPNGEGELVGGLFYDPEGLTQWVMAFVDGPISEDEASDLIDSVGAAAAYAKLQEAASLYFPEANPKDAPEDPPKAV